MAQPTNSPNTQLAFVQKQNHNPTQLTIKQKKQNTKQLKTQTENMWSEKQLLLFCVLPLTPESRSPSIVFCSRASPSRQAVGAASSSSSSVQPRQSSKQQLHFLLNQKKVQCNSNSNIYMTALWFIWRLKVLLVLRNRKPVFHMSNSNFFFYQKKGK